MNPFPYALAPDPRPTMGLIVLQADETIEDDFRRLFAPDQVRLLISRIPSGAALTPDTIRAMKSELPRAAGLFPKKARFLSVAYACTSGTTLIGDAHVAALVRSACQTEHVTNPLAATLAALKALSARRVGIVSPYTPDIGQDLRAAFENAGHDVPQMLSFGEEVEANVARIAPASIAEAARSLSRTGPLDAIFLSCTNLRTLDLIGPLEDELGLPVLSSNQTLAWHMAATAGLDPTLPPGLGRLAGLRGLG